MPTGQAPWKQADGREEIKLDVDPHPEIQVWPATFKELDQLQERLDPMDPSRLPDNWDPERLEKTRWGIDGASPRGSVPFNGGWGCEILHPPDVSTGRPA